MIGRETVSGTKDIARQVLKQTQRPGRRLLGLQGPVVDEPEGQLETVSGHPIPRSFLFTVEITQPVGDVVPVRARLRRTVDGDAVQRII